MTVGYVNIESAVSEACSRLGITNEEAYSIRFKRLILDAEIKIGTGLNVGIKHYIYEPGCVSFSDGIRLLKPHNVIDQLSVYEIVDEKYVLIDRCDYIEKLNYIYFKEVKTNSICLSFNGILIDLAENPIISQNHYEAVVAYLVYMEMTTRYYSKKTPQYMFADARNHWFDEVGNARGNDAYPSDAEYEESGAVFYTTKLFLINGEQTCPYTDPLELLKNYCSLKNLKYGFLPIGQSIINPEDYVAGTINEQEISIGNATNGSLVIPFTAPAYLVMIVPFDTGAINSMKDALGNEIFPNYFTKLDDMSRNLYIYVAKNFLVQGNYNLTFKFDENV